MGQHPVSGQRRSLWQKAAIKAAQDEIRAELDQAGSNSDARARLDIAMERSQRLADDTSPKAMMRRYIYIVSALVDHERHGGLTRTQVEGLLGIAFTILKTSSIQPTARHLGFLHGDLYAIRSQILRKAGFHLEAAWDQELASRFSAAAASPGLGTMAMGNRALRLGDAAVAIRLFQQAGEMGLSGNDLARNRYCLAISLMLNDHAADADRVSQFALGQPDLSTAFRDEIQWLRLCIELRATQRLEPMLKAVSRGRPHYQAGYVVEACMWALTMRQREWLDKVPNLTRLRRNSTVLRPQKCGFFFDSAAAVQDAYDVEVPLLRRLHRLRHVLVERRQLLNIDKELLLLASAVRWLARSKAFRLAALCYGEYRALSLRLADGASSDALGVLADVTQTTWLAEWQAPGDELPIGGDLIEAS